MLEIRCVKGVSAHLWAVVVGVDGCSAATSTHEGDSSLEARESAISSDCLCQRANEVELRNEGNNTTNIYK